MGKNVNKLHKDGSLFCLELSSGLMGIIRGPDGLRSQASQYREIRKSHVPGVLLTVEIRHLVVFVFTGPETFWRGGCRFSQ